jgi:nicotinate phosphoribosyltransferase
MIPSDGLSLESMIANTYKWQDQIKVSSGWGTLLTNDTGLGHPSIVIKAVLAWIAENDKRGCVKFGDNLAKKLDPENQSDRYVRVFGYHTDYNAECQC